MLGDLAFQNRKVALDLGCAAGQDGDDDGVFRALYD